MTREYSDQRTRSRRLVITQRIFEIMMFASKLGAHDTNTAYFDGRLLAGQRRRRPASYGRAIVPGIHHRCRHAEPLRLRIVSAEKLFIKVKAGGSEISLERRHRHVSQK